MKNNQITPYSRGQNSCVPVANPQFTRIMQTIIPTRTNHDVAGKVVTTIHLKDRNGNEMSICQRQSVLNLNKGAHGTWIVGSDNRIHNHSHRRKTR